MASREIERLLRELADREAIRELPGRYCDCVWRKDAEGLAELFSDPCSLELSQGPPLSSPGAIREEFARLLAPEGFTALPYIHNHVFDLDGDRASGRAALELRTIRDGESGSARGFYEDEYVREGGRWKIRSRRFHPRD